MHEIRRGMAQALDPSRRKSLQTVFCTQESSEHSAPMHIIAAQIGVRNQSLLRPVVVFQCKVKNGRHRVLHVAGRAQAPAHNRVVGVIKPLQVRKTIERVFLAPDLLEKDFAKRLSGKHLQKEMDEDLCGGGHLLAQMGEREVFERRLPGPGVIMPVENNNGNQPHQASDVLLHDPALMGILACRIAGEKMAMVFFHIRVAVRPGRCHESDVSLQIVVRGVSPVGIKGVHQESTELKIQRVLPGFQELVIVNPSFAPVLCLVVKNVALFVERTVGRTPQDAVRMGILGGDEIFHPTIVPAKS